MLLAMGQRAQQAAACLAALSTAARNQALLLIAEALQQAQAAVIQAKQRDRAAAQQSGLSAALQDRLLLNS